MSTPRPSPHGDPYPAHRREPGPRPTPTEREGATAPRFAELPNEKVLVAHARGDPGRVSGAAIERLYAAVEELRAKRRALGKPDFEPGPPRARWTIAPDAPRDEWEADFAVHVPDDVSAAPTPALAVQRWRYGKVAEAVHEGPFATEPRTIGRLMAFIAENGLHVAGPHEEVYLTMPGASPQRTIIRYPVA